MTKLQNIRGVLFGTAVGDALGLPFENLEPSRVKRLMKTPLRHQMLLGNGFLSDDTEHTFHVAAALAETDSPEEFQRALGRRLRWWFWGLPAGIGLGTLRACLRLTIGFPASRSGVSSAGNGPAMRSALLGIAVPPALLATYVAACTRLTHTDPRAEAGALAVAFAASQLRAGNSPETLLSGVADQIQEPEIRGLLNTAAEAAERQLSPPDFALQLGLEHGVTGFVNHTVPIALYIAATSTNFETAIRSAIELGGDTDTVAAITGALAGVRFGPDAIPEEWTNKLSDWPLSTTKLEAAALALATGKPPPRLAFVATMSRNLLFFMPLVLMHLARRLLPPY